MTFPPERDVLCKQNGPTPLPGMLGNEWTIATQRVFMLDLGVYPPPSPPPPPVEKRFSKFENFIDLIFLVSLKSAKKRKTRGI